MASATFRNPPKVKDIHASDLLRLLLYFRRLWNRGHLYEHIPLSRLRGTLSKPSWHHLLLIAANVYFERETKGSNLTQQVSKWKRKEAPHVNRQIERIIANIERDNCECIQEMWKIAGEKNEIEITVTTRVIYKNQEAADLVRELINEKLNSTSFEPQRYAADPVPRKKKIQTELTVD